MKWSGKKFDDLELNLDEPGLVFKAQLFALTGVEPDRQKIIAKGGMLKVGLFKHDLLHCKRFSCVCEVTNLV